MHTTQPFRKPWASTTDCICASTTKPTRVDVIDLRDFETKQIVVTPIDKSEHSGTSSPRWRALMMEDTWPTGTMRFEVKGSSKLP